LALFLICSVVPDGLYEVRIGKKGMTDGWMMTCVERSVSVRKSVIEVQWVAAARAYSVCAIP